MQPIPMEIRVSMPDADAGEAVRMALPREVDALLTDLGIPVSPRLSVLLDAVHAPEDGAVWIAGRECENRPDAPVHIEVGIAAGIALRLHACVESFLTDEVVDGLWLEWGGAGASAPADFHTLQRKLLRYRLRLDRVRSFVPAWGEGSAAEAFEAALSGASRRVVCELHPETLRMMDAELTSADGGFGMMIDGLFYELGIRTGECVLALAEDLDREDVRVRLNDLRTPALPLPGEDERLVNDTPERLRLLGVEGRPARNPANGNECAIIGATDAEVCEQSGLILWTPGGFLVLLVSGLVRRCAKSLVSRDVVRLYLDQLRQAFPVLCARVDEQLGVDLVGGALRALLEEEISVRNLPLILESILMAPPRVEEDIDRFIAFGGSYGSIRPRMALPGAGEDRAGRELAECARMSLKSYISHKYTRGQNTLVVYLMDPALESRLTEQRELRADERKELLDAVRTEVGTLPSTAQSPVVLTTASVRHRLWREVHGPFPRLTVLSYQELSPDMNIQPIARISA